MVLVSLHNTNELMRGQAHPWRSQNSARSKRTHMGQIKRSFWASTTPPCSERTKRDHEEELRRALID
jgi:hypothetical protein